MYQCKTCRKPFKSQAALRGHQNRTGHIPNEAEASKFEPEQEADLLVASFMAARNALIEQRKNAEGAIARVNKQLRALHEAACADAKAEVSDVNILPSAAPRIPGVKAPSIIS